MTKTTGKNSSHTTWIHKLKVISLVKKKTDKIDAEKLAIVLKMKVKSNQRMFEPVHKNAGIYQVLE